eukprot:COSAG06_NODE_7916_length_2335_cov_1.227639_2_plen_191_part_00
MSLSLDSGFSHHAGSIELCRDDLLDHLSPYVLCIVRVIEPVLAHPGRFRPLLQCLESQLCQFRLQRRATSCLPPSPCASKDTQPRAAAQTCSYMSCCAVAGQVANILVLPYTLGKCGIQSGWSCKSSMNCPCLKNMRSSAQREVTCSQQQALAARPTTRSDQFSFLSPRSHLRSDITMAPSHKRRSQRVV